MAAKKLLVPRSGSSGPCHDPEARWHELLVVWLHAAAGLLAFLIGILTAASDAHAQEAPAFPGRPVTIVTTFSVGSGPDAMMRVVGEKLSRLWKQPVVVDNRPGGAGFIAIQALQGAKADGHTLLLHDADALSALPSLYPSRNFRTFDALEPVGVLYSTPFMIVVPSGSRWKSVADLVGAARAQPNAVRYGSWGVGSSAHLQSVLFESAAGVRMLHVPYKEMSMLYTGVATGESDWAFGAAASAKFVLESGKARALAVASSRRLAQLPQVPTVQESGGPAFEYTGLAVLLAPKGTPATLREKVHADLLRAVHDPDTQARFATFGFEASDWSPGQVRSAMEARAATFRALIEKSALKLD
jgi:tripartite-type tricarboxylate transporter receptor subunit TctC